jgi:hypothetical protein
MGGKTFAVMLLLVGLAFALPAEAQEAPVDKRPGQGGSAPAAGSGVDAVGGDEVHREGEYGGVTPGQEKPRAALDDGKKPTKKAKAKAASGPLVSWVGFQKQESGGARVFVQCTGAAAYEQAVSGDRLVVFLPGAKLGDRNNGRFLDTSFFDTRVARIEVHASGRKRGEKPGLAVVVSFKKGAATQASAKVETGADGLVYLFLDFAP